MVKKRQGKKPTKIDWDKALSDYLNDNTLSLTDIAERYGVSKQTVQVQSRKNNWSDMRRELSEEALNEARKKRLEDLEGLNDGHANAFSKLAELGEAIVERYTAQMNDPDSNKKLPDARQIQAAASVIKTGIEGTRITKGLPINIVKQEGNIKVEKVSARRAAKAVDVLLKRGKKLEKLAAKEQKEEDAQATAQG